jgi:hypothetical protein
LREVGIVVVSLPIYSSGEAGSKEQGNMLKEGGHSCPPFNGGLENPPSYKEKSSIGLKPS